MLVFAIGHIGNVGQVGHVDATDVSLFHRYSSLSSFVFRISPFINAA